MMPSRRVERARAIRDGIAAPPFLKSALGPLKRATAGAFTIPSLFLPDIFQPLYVRLERLPCIEVVVELVFALDRGIDRHRHIEADNGGIDTKEIDKEADADTGVP